MKLLQGIVREGSAQPFEHTIDLTAARGVVAIEPTLLKQDRRVYILLRRRGRSGYTVTPL